MKISSILPSKNTSLPSGRIRELDGIRGIAILMVVIIHFTVWTGNASGESPLIRALFFPVQYFWSGVDLFFVLSGFLIGGIILDRFKSPTFFKVFWIRRACRILPALILLLTAYHILKATVDPALYEWIFRDEMPWWSYLTFTQNIMMAKAQGASGGLGITWSLAVEEQFYFIAPISIVLLGRKRWLRALFFLVFVAFALRVLSMKFELQDLAVHASLLTRMDPLLGGVLIAALCRSPKAYQLASENRFLILLCFLTMLLCTAGLMWRQGFGLFMYAWFSALYTTLLCAVLLYRNSWVTFPFRARFLTFFGSISYGLYLYHQTINFLVHGYLLGEPHPYFFEGPQFVNTTIIAFLVSVLFSWLSFKLYEKPFLRFAHRFDYE